MQTLDFPGRLIRSVLHGVKQIAQSSVGQDDAFLYTARTDPASGVDGMKQIAQSSIGQDDDFCQLPPSKRFIWSPGLYVHGVTLAFLSV
jgi:hypothetical protein